MGAVAGVRVACSLSSWLPGPDGCVPGGFPAGALLALVALPLLGRGTRLVEPPAGLLQNGLRGPCRIG